MHRRLVRSHLRRPLTGLLMCALLVTQTLGLLHRVRHTGAPPALQVAQGAALEALFADHQGGGDCQLFDHACHADGVSSGPVEPDTLAPAQPTMRALPLSQIAAQAAGYLARGPPRLA